MTKEEAKHWFYTVLLDIAIAIICIIIAVRYTNHKVSTLEPKLDLIIEQQDTIINKLSE